MALASEVPSTLAKDGQRASINSLANNAYLGQISGTTTTTQTGGWLDLTGFAGFTLEVIQATFLGSYRIEVSNDDASTKTHVYRLDQNNNPTTAQSNSYLINNVEGWKYLRAIGAPTGSNAGTVDFYIRRLDPSVTPAIQSGYADHMGRQQVLYASANRTSNLSKTDIRVKGRGFTMIVDVTANSGAHGVFSIYRKDLQTGKYTATLLDSADLTSTGVSTYTVYPDIATVANVSAIAGGSEWAIDTQSITNMTFSVTIQPLA
jgi:hypothetical protein